MNCYWRKQGCAFEPISTDAYGAVLKSIITDHIHHENHSKVSGTVHLVYAGVRQGPNVARLPTISHINMRDSTTLQQLPYYVNSAADIESGRPSKRHKVMQEINANSMGPAGNWLTTAHSASRCTSLADGTTRDHKVIEENGKAASCTGIVKPLQTSTINTSLAQLEMSKSRRHVLQDESHRIAQPKSSGYQRSRNSTRSIMSLRNLVNNFDAVAEKTCSPFSGEM